MMSMNKSEKIYLDAHIVIEVKNNVFRAKLANGHHIVAVVREKGEATSLEAGFSVKVMMSPFDMSTGIVVG